MNNCNCGCVNKDVCCKDGCKKCDPCRCNCEKSNDGCCKGTSNSCKCK